VPTPKQVIWIDLGERDVTTAESDAYVGAVDVASPRVISDSLGKSVQGRDLRYAIVGEPERVTAQGLARIRSAAAQLMDPATRPREARAIAAREPAILWIAGNVHGGEESAPTRRCACCGSWPTGPTARRSRSSARRSS
jgi:Zinc carboxypeptidase